MGLLRKALRAYLEAEYLMCVNILCEIILYTVLKISSPMKRSLWRDLSLLQF